MEISGIGIWGWLAILGIPFILGIVMNKIMTRDSRDLYKKMKATYESPTRISEDDKTLVDYEENILPNGYKIVKEIFDVDKVYRIKVEE